MEHESVERSAALASHGKHEIETPGQTEGEPMANLRDGPEARRATPGGSFIARFALILVVLALAGLFSGLTPNLFPTSGNLNAMLVSQSIPLLLALTVIIPLRAGDFDLSISAVMVLSAAVTAILSGRLGVALPLAILVVLTIGAVVGLINSLFAVKFGINAFIVTLGMMTLLEGFTYGITNGNVITDVPTSLTDFARSSVLGLPAAVYYGWIAALVLWYIFEFTPIGRRLLFVGGNPEAARLAGISVGRVRTGAFVAASIGSAFAGVVLVGQLGAADPTLGPSYLLPPYAAAFLGMAAVQLGRFNVWGSLIAVYLLIVATTGLLLLGTQSWVTDVFNGAALMLAVAFTRFVEYRNSRTT
jgi:ribose transport system permease protein